MLPLACTAIICTRNRPEDLRRTLKSIDAQHEAGLRLLVVDASDAEAWQTNRKSVDDIAMEGQHVRYDAPPSLARQRNAGLDWLPEPTDIVFFFDDDVTLSPDYFQIITRYFDTHPEVGGVGPKVTEPAKQDASAQGSFQSARWRERIRHAFLLDHPLPGRVLLSGHASTPHTASSDHPTDVKWLSGGACAYRREVFRTFRFDNRLRGYSLYEDRDFSFRVHREWPLVALPAPTLTHYASPINRLDVATYTARGITHRYWFVEKNFDHPLRRIAFWWATLGQFLALLASPRERSRHALQGLLEGVRQVLHGEHPGSDYTAPSDVRAE
jgi:GT2 family glycosyltransferase